MEMLGTIDEKLKNHRLFRLCHLSRFSLVELLEKQEEIKAAI